MTQPQQKNITHLGSLRRNQIYNRLNALHYQSAPLLVCLQHKTHDHCIYLKAHPEPVADENTKATWDQNETIPENLSAFAVAKIIIDSGRDNYEFTPVEFHLGAEELHFSIPEDAVKSGFRKQHRFPCADRNILLTLTQNAIVFKGRLLDYSASGILVDLNGEDDLSFAWLNKNLPAMLTVLPDNDPVYTGQVSLTPRGDGQYLLLPNLDPTPRYMSKQFRTHRQELVPSPDLRFTHPVTGKKYSLKICDLSSLGFSVDEETTRASLIPGLLIRNAKISFANNLVLPCIAQVVYFRHSKENPKSIHIGFAILRIDSKDHLRLINMVQQARDPRAYVSNQIDPADLFDFFFETGFLYPKKYVEIASKREEISKSYLTLYEKGVDVSRHFVYQSFGQILGHFSTLRVYRNTWLNQHHAALNDQRAGLRVVRAVSEYMNDSYQLNPKSTKYIIGYYQKTNRFPKKYFGGYVDGVNDPKQTSLDSFSYVKEARRFAESSTELSCDWTLETATASDIGEFYQYYKATFGGLLPDALDMVPDGFDDQTLAETFQVNGLIRQRELHVLRYQGLPKSLIDVQSSDFGLNLSEITNSISVFMIELNPEYFDSVCSAVANLALNHKKLSDPVMFFPNNYLSLCGRKADKEYILWALDIAQGVESYMTWMNRYCR